MNRSEATSIVGGWLGIYYYRGAQSREEPVRFEATFAPSSSSGKFAGSILDDGPLGAADTTGVQVGRQVRFTKVYRRPPRTPDYQVAPIVYEGTLSEDGQKIKGTWTISFRTYGIRQYRVRGVWEAQRIWSVQDEAEQKEKEIL